MFIHKVVEQPDAASAQSPERIHLQSCHPVCSLKIAPVTLHRCMDNLINNALRYSGNSKIEIVCKRSHHALFIAVRDRGPGIASDLVDVVFHPFFRIETSRNRATGGSGLGLAITRQLAETQGWQVKIKQRYGGRVSAWILISIILT